MAKTDFKIDVDYLQLYMHNTLIKHTEMLSIVLGNILVIVCDI